MEGDHTNPSLKQSTLNTSTPVDRSTSRVQSITTARFITPPLTRRKRALLNTLLDQFAASVNFCIRKCLEHNLTSLGNLYRTAYEEWKSRFDLATHWFHSTARVATHTLRSWRTLCRKGQANPKEPPLYRARTMRLGLWGDKGQSGVCRFKGNSVQIRIRKGEYLWLPLIVTEYHEIRYLRDWHEVKAKVGEITISAFKGRANVYVPFKREVEPKQTEGICGIDINERSVDLCILKPNQGPRFIKLDVSRLPAIRHASQLKRNSIQKKLDAPPQRPLQKQRLQAKYRHRERNRTNEILHVVSKEVAEILASKKVRPVFEDLANIRHSMRSRRKSKNGRVLRRDMRRRLNQWPFRKLQLYIEYKTLQRGYSSHYLPHERVRGTSSTCPICGTTRRPNGHVFSCRACGFVGDRQYVAAYNIATRWTKNVGSDVPPEWRQMKPSVEKPVASAKPLAKAQGIPGQFTVGF